MGVGISLFAAARRQQGWSAARISRFLATRGLLLVFVSFFVELPAWIIGLLSSRVESPIGPDAVIPGDGPPRFVFTVLVGLGLSMVYGFVRQSGGTVSVQSAPGRGSTFSLLLPRTDDTTPSGPPAPRPLTAATHGTGTVLIVEDERALRRLSATVLRQAGYQTIEASDGQQALDLYTVHSHRIVMVVTDVVMPRMGGIELAKRLRALRSDIPLLFVTGYVEQSEILHEQGTPVLLKPFSPNSLLTAVTAALSGGL